MATPGVEETAADAEDKAIEADKGAGITGPNTLRAARPRQIRVRIGIYVCMCVCMHLYMCTYVCLYVCMYACMNVCKCPHVVTRPFARH